MIQIRQLFLLFAAILVLANCKSRPNAAAASTTAKVDTTFTVNTAQTPYPGDLLWKAKWKEGKQNIVLLLSHQLDYQDGDGYDAFFARRFVQAGNAWTPQWVYRDTIMGYGCDLGINLIRPFTEVNDLDADGKQEVIITYTRENRCDASIVETIMLVNNGPQTGKIEGCSQLFLGPPEAVLNDFLRENGQDTVRFKFITPALEDMGKAVKEAASKKWDEMLEWDVKENGQE